MCGICGIFNFDRNEPVSAQALEIYNHKELSAELIARGHHYRTGSDTETIRHSYEEYGRASVERLRGMFAFAIWDSGRRRLFCARDRLGIKPFCYYLGAGRPAPPPAWRQVRRAPRKRYELRNHPGGV